ncbi:MAG: heme o synthase [Candidatus Saccharimonadales bacterium]
MFKDYYLLTKPGIIRGNAIPAIAGFCLASSKNFNVFLLIETLVGISLVIACACVLNNIIDQDIDRKMKRTKNRALVTGAITNKNALLFGIVLGIIGLSALEIFTNILTVLIGVAGLIFYVIIYGWAKRKSIYGTHVGSISGAMPPVAGYVAVSNSIDSIAIILFLILVFWQMAHFFSIGIFRRDEYKKAGIPIWPIKKGLKSTKNQILIYIVLFGIASLSLYFYSNVGLVYLVSTVILLAIWLYVALGTKYKLDIDHWAKNMFGLSVLILSILCIVIALCGLLA